MLVGGIHAPLKNMSSSVGVTIPNMWKVIKFHGSKPPTSPGGRSSGAQVVTWRASFLTYSDGHGYWL